MNGTIMPLNMLYDITIKNLTTKQMGMVLKVICDNIQFEHELTNNRAVLIEGIQKELDMWDLKIYHLKPLVASTVIDTLIKNQLYPVIIELKG